MKRLLDERELSELTGLAVQSLRNMRSQSRGIPYIKISSRAIRYRLEDLEKYLSDRTIIPEEE